MDLGLHDAAALFQVSDSTITRWVREEGLPAFLINGRYRFNRVDLLEWSNQRKRPIAPGVAATARFPAGEVLGPALAAGGIHHRVPGKDVASAMTAAAERLRLPPADRILAAQVLTEREGRSTTALGDGIAIPHPRSPMVFPMEHPLCSLCFLEHPVDFGAADGKPVTVLFLILSPTIRLHLALLSQLAAALHRSDFRSAVDRHAPAEEILGCLGPKA